LPRDNLISFINENKKWSKVLALADEALKRELAAAKALDLGWNPRT
jgi:hypothetical protein